MVATASQDDCGLVTRQGAQIVLDYKSESLWPALRDLAGFDAILDFGGVGRSLEALGYQKLVKPGGTVVTLSPTLLSNIDQYGWLGGAFTSVSDFVAQNASFIQTGATFKWAFFQPDQSALKHLAAMIESGEVKPLVERVYNFSEVLEAFEVVRARRTDEGLKIRGKIVLDMEK